MKPNLRFLFVVTVLSSFSHLVFGIGTVLASRTPDSTRCFADPDQQIVLPSVTIDAAISSIQVVNLEPSSTGVGTQLTITNISGQKIVEIHAYLDQLRVGKRFWGIENDPLPPRGSATLQYNYELAPLVISIAGVVFEDGTGEGNQRVLQDAFKFSNAYRQQLRRHVDVLSVFVKSGELSQSSSLQEGLAKLRQQMEADPASPDINQAADPFELQGRRAANAWIMVPIRHWELLARIQGSVLPHSDASARIHKDLLNVKDKCLDLDRRLARRTAR